MSVNDPGVKLSESIEVDGRSVRLERRYGVIADNLLDAAARRYAVLLRLGETSEEAPPVASYTLARDVTRVR